MAGNPRSTLPPRPRMTFVVAVVDDDARILESLEDLLESAGHAVRLFTSATALLENCSFAEIDCLRSEEHTSELQSRLHLVCRLLLEKKKKLKSSCLSLTSYRVSLRPVTETC